MTQSSVSDTFLPRILIWNACQRIGMLVLMMLVYQYANTTRQSLHYVAADPWHLLYPNDNTPVIAGLSLGLACAVVIYVAWYTYVDAQRDDGTDMFLVFLGLIEALVAFGPIACNMSMNVLAYGNIILAGCVVLDVLVFAKTLDKIILGTETKKVK